MTKSDMKEFASCMAALQETFTPEKPISRQKVALYFEVFSQFTIEEFKQACLKVTQTKKISTFPLPAEIKEALQGDAETQALLAYTEFKKAKDRIGAYDSVVFKDFPLIHHVVHAMGGWEDVCYIPEEEWKFRKQDFLKFYKSFLQHPRLPDPPLLVGILERTNMASGFKNKKDPIVIAFDAEATVPLIEGGGDAYGSSQDNQGL